MVALLASSAYHSELPRPARLPLAHLQHRSEGVAAWLTGPDTTRCASRSSQVSSQTVPIFAKAGRWAVSRLPGGIYGADASGWPGWCSVAEATIEERLERIEKAVDTLGWWLVQAQTGFSERDARGISDILNGRPRG